METEQARAIARRSFRKHGHVLAGGKQGIDLGVHDPGMSATAAAQEDRIRLRGKPACERPLPYVGLGDEGDRMDSIDHEDIDPRDVVGNDQAAELGFCQFTVAAYRQYREQLF